MGKQKKGTNTPCLDLHGIRTDDVADMVDRFLRSAKGDRVQIMTGKGSGKVRQEVIRYLDLAKYPWQYERLGNGQPNEGVLVVFLD